VPFSGSLSAQIFPPCLSIIFFVDARPIPVPGYSDSLCRRLKGWNISFDLSGEKGFSMYLKGAFLTISGVLWSGSADIWPEYSISELSLRKVYYWLLPGLFILCIIYPDEWCDNPL